MKILFLILSLTFCITNVYSQKSNSSKPKANQSKEKQGNNLKLAEAELRKELSGMYEGTIEIELCCDGYDYANGKVYFDLTKDPIAFIYSGSVRNDNYYYENGKIIYKSSDFNGDPVCGWFENLNGKWVYWQKFYGYENDGFTERKPGYIVKNSGLERCTEIIEVYLKEDSDFRNFADQFKLAIVNSDFDFLENSIALPLEDGYRENLSKIKSGKEFCKRIKLYFGDFQTSTAEYFAHYWRELEAANNYPGAYFFSGSINMIFEKVNGAYKLTRMGSWG